MARKRHLCTESTHPAAAAEARAVVACAVCATAGGTGAQFAGNALKAVITLATEVHAAAAAGAAVGAGAHAAVDTIEPLITVAHAVDAVTTPVAVSRACP